MRIRLSTDLSTASASSWHTSSISTHADARGTNRTHEQKKSGTTPTTRKAPFAAWNPRFVSHEMEKRKREEREIEKLEQVSDGTPDSFSEIMGTGPKFVLKVPLRHTLLHETKGGKKWKMREVKKREVSHSRWLDRWTIDDGARLTNADDRRTRISELFFGNFIFARQTNNVDPLYRI